MPSPPQGPTGRRPSATERPHEVPDAYVPTAYPPAPPPLPLIRRKAQAEALETPHGEGSVRPAAATAPWPTPPSARPYPTEGMESSTPFASSVDLDPQPATDASEAEWSAVARPWWRRLKAPSRPLWIGALVAMVSAGLGWTAGAKPWKPQRAASSVAAAKANPGQQRSAASKSAARRDPQATPRRVAVKSPTQAVTPAPKAKAAAASPAPAKGKVAALAPAQSKAKVAALAPAQSKAKAAPQPKAGVKSASVTPVRSASKAPKVSKAAKKSTGTAKAKAPNSG